ncbi:MAG: sugar phosphate isomerase/epimerase family protein [Propionibacteriaceae bacterium]
MTNPDTAVPAQHDWPIAAAMINFPGVLPDGTVVQDQPVETWQDTLQQVADTGFTHLDPTDSWVRIADLSPDRLTEFSQLLDEVGLVLGGISTARRSIIDAEHGDAYLAYGHRVIDTAAKLGVADVSFGLFQALSDAQKKALWFWTAPGYVDSDDPAAWQLAVERFQELGRHAKDVGVHISLEMYEDTYLGTADSSVRFLHDIGLDNVWLNPDIGNLQRLHRPVEHWQAMIDKTVPYARYWHVKNYFRTEDATTGAIVTAPAPLELGVINYRSAVRQAIASGFDGTFLCEHYGGDGLSVSARNREYLQRVLPARSSSVQTKSLQGVSA